jgi:hypothetical protein
MRDKSGCKYVKFPSNNISIWTAFSRKTVSLEEQTLNKEQSPIRQAGITIITMQMALGSDGNSGFNPVSN